MFALNPELIEEGSKTLYNAYLGKQKIFWTLTT